MSLSLQNHARHASTDAGTTSDESSSSRIDLDCDLQKVQKPSLKLNIENLRNRTKRFRVHVATDLHNDHLEIFDSSSDSSSIIANSGYSNPACESTQKRIPGINKNVMTFPKNFTKLKL